MRPIAAASLLALGLLCACGPRATPEAPPGAVERTTEALARNEAAELNRTARRIDAEAEARAEASEERIEAIEEGQPNGD